MAYFHSNRITDHSEARTYVVEGTEQLRTIITSELMTAMAIARRLPANGTEVVISRSEVMRMAGYNQPKTFAEHTANLHQAGLIHSYQKRKNDSYTFSLGERLECENTGCLDPYHFPGSDPRSVDNRTPFDKRTRQSRKSKLASLENPNEQVEEPKSHITTKELNNSKNQALAESEEIVQVKPVFVTTAQVDQRRQAEVESPEEIARQIKRSWALAGLDKALADEKKGENRPLNRCLKEYVLIRSIAGKDSLEFALEWSAKGYDLDPQGEKWKKGSAQVESELIQVGGNE